MERNDLLKNMMALWIAATALTCAAISMQITRNMLATEDISGKETDYDEEAAI